MWRPVFDRTYRLTEEPPTPAATLVEARRLGREEGLHYVYAGNRPGDRRGGHRVPPLRPDHDPPPRGFAVIANELTAAGACRGCGAGIAGRALGGEL